MKSTRSEGQGQAVQVAPFAGAWIEISIQHEPIVNLSSLPSRERGLKSTKDIQENNTEREKGGNEPMRNVNLEENELTITAIFQQHTKEETIQTLKEALEVLEQEESDPENDEMIEVINSTVGKLQQIEDKYYYSLDLNYYLNNLEDDAYEA